MIETRLSLAEQFDDPLQQREAATLGIWTFLATEILFFGGLFLAYIAYRSSYPEAFAQASRHTLVLYGTINTAVLLTSSLTMAMAVRAAQLNHIRNLTRLLLFTIMLGICFLSIKAMEYHEDWKEHLIPGSSFTSEIARPGEIFWFLYWAMTGLHALHVVIGLGLLSIIAWLARKGRFSATYHNPVEVSGLYWHFVDIVWIFLYPLLYLINRST